MNALWESKKVIEKGEPLIKPDGFKIPKKTSRINGITTEMAKQKGSELKKVLELFNQSIDKT